MYIGDEPPPPSSSSKSRNDDHDDSTQGRYVYRINQLIDMEELLVAQAQRYSSVHDDDDVPLRMHLDPAIDKHE